VSPQQPADVGQVVGEHAADPEVHVVRRGARAVVQERVDHGVGTVAPDLQVTDAAVVVEDDGTGP
jgi:hypothetical protein